MLPKRHVVIIVATVLFLSGLLLGHWGLEIGWEWPLLAAITALAVRRTRWLLPALLTLALVAGIWRGWQAGFDYRQLAEMSGHKVYMAGQLIGDPAGDGPYSFTVGSLNDGRPVAGTVLVVTPAANLERGYHVELSGKLEPGKYGGYELFYPQLTISSTNQDWLERLRQRFFVGVRVALPEPLASFALGLLVGNRALVPKDLQVALAATGLSHLVAVSGYNLTIILRAIKRLKQLSLRLYVVGAVWLVMGFCLLAGFSASIVRAAIVAGLSLAAYFYGKDIRPITIVAVAAFINAAAHPEYLWSDIGWQLSFLAFLGIMVMAPAISRKFKFAGTPLGGLVVESLAAQLMTMPLIMAVFGQLAWAGLLANVVIMPLVPLGMALSFVAGLAGMLLPALAGWVSWPAAWLLHLMVSVIAKLASANWASQTVTMSAASAVGLYLSLTALTLVLARRRSLPAA